MDRFLSYYGYAEVALYFLVALLCALRAHKAFGAYEGCFGVFVLFTFPAMYLDASLGIDVPGIAYVIVAPVYAIASPLMFFVIRWIWPRAPELPVVATHSSVFVRLCGALGRALGRASRSPNRKVEG